MENIILDLDTGIDDTMALALAVIDSKVNLLGVTTTYGNVTTNVSCLNSRFILDLFGEENIPVAKGLDFALNSTKFKRHLISAQIHGDNGLGNLPISLPPYNEDDFESFITFTLKMIKKYENNITIVTTGPLTNVAFLLQNYPEEMKGVNKIVSMGGAIICPGNINTYAEANINQDPLAAKIVMESDIKKVLVPLDVTQKARITSEEVAKWESHNTKSGTILSGMVNHYILQHSIIKQCFIHDPSAVMYCIHPEYFTTLDKNMSVLVGEECKGRVISNFDKIRDKITTTKLCLDVEETLLSDYINNSFNKFFSEIKD